MSGDRAETAEGLAAMLRAAVVRVLAGGLQQDTDASYQSRFGHW
ncbi:MAG: hypothetical protein ACJ8DZ_13925 [Allosphingosinicella sp.]